jgi:methylphosphotriester-DNA--protein-cysteine methyltransferase
VQKYNTSDFLKLFPFGDVYIIGGSIMKIAKCFLLVCLSMGVSLTALAADGAKKEPTKEPPVVSMPDVLVASKGGASFHLASCTLAANIKAENKITFKSGKEAADAGYKPCAKCNPPVSLPAADTKVVGINETKVYHSASCKAVTGLKDDAKTVFDTAQAAFDAGFTACTGCCNPPVATKVVGSKESDKYHFASCKFAKNIKEENLRTWDSPEAAAKDGCAPCGGCKPPAAKKEEAKEEPKKEDKKPEPKKEDKKAPVLKTDVKKGVNLEQTRVRPPVEKGGDETP